MPQGTKVFALPSLDPGGDFTGCWRMVPYAGVWVPETEESVDAAELLQAILDSPSQHAIILTDLDGTVRLWNRGAQCIFQYESDEIVGTDIRVLFAPDDKAKGVPEKEMAKALEHGWAGDFRWHVRKDGSLFWADGMLYPVRSHADELLGYVKILRDATAEKKTGDETSRLALEDSLTGLPNRAEFQHRFVDMRASAERHGRLLALLLLDLDRFKDVNDSRGHATGDTLLQQVAHRMRAAVRDTDFVGRLGGDEFVILLPDLETPEEGGSVAEHLMEELARPFSINQEPAHIGASIGISVFPQNARELEDLLGQADVALYQVKAAGRSAYRFYTPEMDEAAHRRSQQRGQLRHAIKDRAFGVLYQPQVDADGRPVSVEAFLRCLTPFFAESPANEIVAIATELGRMRRLGRWMMSEAMRQHQLLRQRFPSAPTLCVNVSRDEFSAPRFAEWVTDLLARFSLPASQLELDISEAHLVGELDTSQLHALHRLGVSITLDDLGMGGLSLKHLFELPISSAKLDLRFLPGFPENRRSRAIAMSITQLARLLDIRIVAERVETREQAHFLQPQCDGIQGNYVAAPMDAAALMAWMQGHVPSAETETTSSPRTERS